MSRGPRPGSSVGSSSPGDNSAHLKDQLQLAIREKDELVRTLENLKAQFT